MYVQRRLGEIVGCFRSSVPGIAEEFLVDDNAEVVAFLSANQNPRLLKDILEVTDCTLDATIMNLINQSRAEWRAWAGTNFPTLTGAEKTRLGDLFWVVSVGTRQRVRAC